MKLTIVEIMRSEVCHNFRNNCDNCPLVDPCESGIIEDLIKESREQNKYTIECQE